MTGERPADDVRPAVPVNAPERALEHPAEAGAYIGHEPERAADTIPGGVDPDDQRIAAHSTQGTGAGRPDEHARTPVDSAGLSGADGASSEPG